jgi:hypothetical protein
MGVNREYTMQAMEALADYAAMLKGAMALLKDTGLSDEAAEAVLMNALDIPGWVREPWEDDGWEDWDEDDFSDEED